VQQVEAWGWVRRVGGGVGWEVPERVSQWPINESAGEMCDDSR
jgi:hypothetical protein